MRAQRITDLFRYAWQFALKAHYDERGGTGTATAADDTITHTKMNLKLETVDGSDLVTGSSRAQTFLANAFICPAPGTDWTPQLEGCGLAQNKAAKKVWIPLNFLKIGDIITGYRIVGDVVEGGGDTVTFDCKLTRVNKADPLTTTDITNGGIVQVTADGNFDVLANNDDETIATDKQYVLECLGTTSNVSATEQIIVTGAEVMVTRLVGAP